MHTEKIREVDLQISEILSQTSAIREGLNRSYTQCLNLFGRDYTGFNEDQKKELGALVNQTKALSALFGKTVS